MVTKRELIDALSGIKDDDEVLIALRTPDDDDTGFSETEGTDKKDASDDEDPGYIECPVDEIEVVDATDDSGAKALLLYCDIPESDDDEDDDAIYVDESGHYVDKDDNYVTKDGDPSDTPVKADPADLEDA